MVDTAPPLGARRPAAAQGGGSISVRHLCRRADEATLAALAPLADGAATSPAQTSTWVGAWLEETGSDSIVAIRYEDERPVLALALAVERVGPFRVACFPGSRHANGNGPAVDSAWPGANDPKVAEELVAAIAEARPDIDLLALERLRPESDNTPNPLLALAGADSPDVALSVDLSGGFDAVLDRSNPKRRRKRWRSSARKFEAAGGYRRFQATTPAEVDRLLDAFFAMKAARFRAAGIPDVFAPEPVRAFFRRLFTDAVGPTPRRYFLEGLEVGGKLRAVTGSSRTGTTVVCEFGAIADDDLASASPGDFLFFEAIAEACAEGATVYDFSVGDELYKRLWCDQETVYRDALLPMTAKGRVLAGLIATRGAIKRRIRQNNLLWPVFKVLRRLAAGRSGTPASPPSN
jgi:CelD/BcsL family acetyltransferase involved in cellulose biosynthesis